MIEYYIKPAFYSKSFFSIGVLCFNLKKDDLIIKLCNRLLLERDVVMHQRDVLPLSLVPSLVDVSPVLLTKEHVRCPFPDN